MKKILIVDDHALNRSLLREVVEEYSIENKIELLIDEAENGVEAVRLFKQNSYDLIFMDITMPEMDGIEATRHIREINKKVLIVAISAQNDIKTQKEILDAGVEDYISKPVNVNIFLARLDNYLTLIKSRQTHITHHEATNLFSSLIYTRKVSFYIETDNDLAEFWEYFLLNPHITYHNISSITRILYDIGLHALKINIRPMIWIEESEDHIYITMEGLSQLEPDFIRTTLTKNSEVIDFKAVQNKLSIQTQRESINHPPVLPVKIIKETPATAPIQPIPPIAEEKITPAPPIIELQIYHYMDQEDLENINDHLSRLHSLLLMVGSGDVSLHEVEEIAYYLDRIGRSASMYSESYPIARALSSLSAAIEKNIQIFIDKSSSLGLFCATFGLDLMNWLQKIFYEGAPSVDFMDDTIISNGQMLESMLATTVSANHQVEMDDIFDF